MMNDCSLSRDAGKWYTEDVVDGAQMCVFVVTRNFFAWRYVPLTTPVQRLDPRNKYTKRATSASIDI